VVGDELNSPGSEPHLSVGEGGGSSNKPLRKASRARTDSAKGLVRDALIRAGGHLFATLDFDDVSLRQIAKHAGYSPGVVYKYFPDRQSLFRAIRDAEIQPFADALEHALHAHTDAEDRIIAMVRLASEFAELSAENFGIRFIYSSADRRRVGDESEPPGIDTSAVSQRTYELHHEATEMFLAELADPSIDAHSATISIIAAVAGMATLPGTVAKGPAANRVELTERMVRALLSYWRATSSGRSSSARRSVSD
jgi:AcrR family transcriptional regulator